MTTKRWTSATVYPDMWVDPSDDPREALANPVGEKETLWNYLKHYRLTLEMKCDGLGGTVARRGGQKPIRDVLVHLVEEYARHVGHADLLRECIDGRVGQ
jgi:hypothetical protein